MGAEHLQTDQSPAQPVVHHHRCSVFVTDSTLWPLPGHFEIIIHMQSFLTAIALVSQDNLVKTAVISSVFPQ